MSLIPRPSAEATARLFEPALDEQDFVQRLRAGDEQAFATLLESHHASLVRLAMVYVSDHAEAEEARPAGGRPTGAAPPTARRPWSTRWR